MLGRDIGEGLSYLIKKSKKKNVKDLLQWLSKWEKREIENLRAKKPKANIEFITDRSECIQMLCEDAQTLEEVKENIKNLFKDGEKKDIVLFSSIHKIKGSETDEVFVLMDTLRGGNIEENNCEYVAKTRPRKKLYLVRKPSKYSQYDDEPSHEQIP